MRISGGTNPNNNNKEKEKKMRRDNRAYLIHLLLLINFGVSASIVPELVRRYHPEIHCLSKKSTHLLTKQGGQMYFHNPTTSLALEPRGGEMKSYTDSNKVILLKTGLNVIAQTGVLFAAVCISAFPKVSTKFARFSFRGLPLSLWITLTSAIFGSSFYGSLVEGGLSQATRQVLNPNVLPGEPNWYKSLKRPWWEPPGWVFPIMWVIVSKPTQLLAVTRLISSQNVDRSILTLPRNELLVYCIYLALGDAWNKVFFGMQSPGLGVVVITTFFAFLLASTYLFYSIDQLAGRFMLPTCAWVLGATALNWSIYLSNKK
jgi:benzodiazapine receptor